MNRQPVLREAGDAALLLELEPVIDLEVNARAVAIAAAVRDRAIAGVRDVVSTYRSVAVYFDPLVTPIDTVREALEAAQGQPASLSAGRELEVPVVYGGDEGPDLAGVAKFAGVSSENVIEIHAARAYRVFMVGFLPGFAYMGSVDERIAAPRHATPRVRVPAGSVGIAGRQTGIYPTESPGGWQIIGRTPLRVFDPTRAEPASFAAGDTVRFVPQTIGRPAPSDVASGSSPAAADVVSGFSRTSGDSSPPRTITVLKPGLLTTIQDEGRWGHQGSGVSVCGAMDIVAHRLANAAVGNDRSAATLEVTLQGPELRIDHEAIVAVMGGDLSVAVDGATLSIGTPVRCRSGSVLRFGTRRSGARAYVAIAGGIDVASVLGSRATHTLTRLGGLDGRALRAGDVLSVGRPAASGKPRSIAASAGPAGGARLRVTAGPQDDVFVPAALDALQRARFTISPQSNRMAYRLVDGSPLDRVDDREMISDATFAGALQVPPSGDPILLLADRQTTGGYPQIATVITADLPLAGQLAPGDWVEFRLCSRSDALSALIAQEARLLAIA